MMITPFTIISNIVLLTLIICILNFSLHLISYETLFPPKALIVLLAFPLLRFFLPLEFSFTYIIRSRNIYPLLIDLFTFNLYTPLFKITVLHLLFCALLLGFVICLVRGLYIYKKFYHLFNSLPYNQDKTIVAYVNNYLEKNGYKKHSIRVVCTNLVEEPMLIGIHNTLIIIPTDLNSNQIYDILQHELAHYVNGDLLIKFVFGIMAYIFWWLPPVRLLKTQVDNVLEIRADQNAVQDKTQLEKINYLNTLIDISQRKNHQNNSAFPAMFTFGDNKCLKKRVNVVRYMHKKRTCYKMRFQRTLFIFLFVISLILPFGIVFQPIYENDNPATFTLTESNSYLVTRDDGQYDIYINNEYSGYICEIDDQMQNMPIVEKKE